MDSYSIGIIGGADGPTAVFVTGNPIPGFLAAAAAALVIAGIIFWLKKKK